MARKNAKVMLEQFMTVHDHYGTERCAVVKLKGQSEFGKKHGVPIGKICEKSNGHYEHSTPTSRHTRHGNFKTKAGAVRGLIKSYRSWIGGESLYGARR